MLRKCSFAINEYYHIYNRGNGKSIIFKCKNDYNRFLFLLFAANGQNPVRIDNLMQLCRQQGRSLLSFMDDIDRGDTLVDIGVYCLMPNHFHILIREKKENGITEFMKKLSTAYAMYFNKRYGRTGSLFEGRFKAQHVDDDMYLKYLFAYIHLNPVKLIESQWKEIGLKDTKKAMKFLNEYNYSSYQDYVNKSDKGVILNKPVFPEYFSTFNDFKVYINEWMEDRDEYSNIIS